MRRSWTTTSPGTHRAGVSSEAVQIAGKYESAEVVKFINGILASFLREEVKD